jgi:hypothetical protein
LKPVTTNDDTINNYEEAKYCKGESIEVTVESRHQQLSRPTKGKHTTLLQERKVYDVLRVRAKLKGTEQDKNNDRYFLVSLVSELENVPSE